MEFVPAWLIAAQIRTPPPPPPDNLEAPYMLTSVVHTKLSLAAEMRAFVNDIRQLPEVQRTFRGRLLWAGVQQSPERRSRNRRLLRAAKILQQRHVLPVIREKTLYKLICWRGAQRSS